MRMACYFRDYILVQDSLIFSGLISHVVIADSRETNFTWQVEAGLHYAFTKNLGMRVGYRYVDMGKFDVDLKGMAVGEPAGNFTGKLTAHELRAAFRYTF